MSDRFRIQLLSDGAKSEEIVGARDVTEHLRRIGLEWKTADYFHTRTAVILVQPYEDETEFEDMKRRLQSASKVLEG